MLTTSLDFKTDGYPVKLVQGDIPGMVSVKLTVPGPVLIWVATLRMTTENAPDSWDDDSAHVDITAWAMGSLVLGDAKLTAPLAFAMIEAAARYVLRQRKLI